MVEIWPFHILASCTCTDNPSLETILAQNNQQCNNVMEKKVEVF